MKHVATERTAIVRALDKAPNITQAARDLHASRRTLQARMRDYSIPPGQSGRPRTLLPKSRFERVDEGALTLALVGLVGLGAWWLWKQRKPAVVVGALPAELPAELRGLDAITR